LLAAALAIPTTQAALVGQWRATDYTSGNWISTPATGSRVAVVDGTPAKITDGYAPGTGGIDLLGNSYFRVVQADNPLAGATNVTLLAVFRPLGTTPSGGSYHLGAGLVSMEQAGVVNDWGMSWNGNRVSAAVPNAGVAERTVYGFPQPIGDFTPQQLNPIQVAMFTSDSNGVQRMFINGVLVSTVDAGSTSPRGTGDFGIGATTGDGANRFNGEISEIRLYNSDETPNAAALAEELRDTYAARIVLEQARLNPQGGKFVLVDTATTQVDASGTFTLLLDNNPVAPVNVSKIGDRTTVTFNQAINHGQVSYSYELTVPSVGGGSNTATGTMVSHRLPLSLPGPSGSVGTWGIRETITGDAPLPANVGDIATAVATALTDPASTDGSAPVLNHTDPDTNNEGSTGNFNNDFPLLANAAGDQNWIVTGKTQVTVAAPGLYTFSVRSDDGMAMRVSGAGGGRFISSSGDAQIDVGDDQTMFRDGGTGDSNARAVYQFDAAGTYDVTYFGWDGGAGGFHEVAWAQGSFLEDRDTNTWRLVGNDTDPSLPEFRERWAVNPAGPAAEDGSFGVRTYLVSGANGLGNMTTFLNTTTRTPENDPGNTIDSQEPYLNHRDPNDGAVYRFVDDLPIPGNNNGVNEDNVVTVAKGRISIPSAGAYTFITTSDDGFVFRLKGTGGDPDPSFRRVTSPSLDPRFQMSNPNEVYYDGAGQETRAIVDLQAGEYDIEYLTVEGGGGFAYELGVAAGEWPHVTTPPNGFQLVGAPAGTVIFPAVAAPGWTVESSIPGLNQFANSIAGADSRITHTQELAENDPIWASLGLNPANRVTTWPQIDFHDPQDGPQGGFTPTSPWPLDTGNPDNDYAVRATGNIVITQAGYYHLGFQGDDGGYMYLYGAGGNADPVIESIVHTNHIQQAVIGVAPGSSVNNAIRVEVGTGNSRTIVRTYLETGEYQIRTLFWEGGGGSWWEVVGGSAAPGYNYPLLSTTSGSATLNSGLTLVAQTGLDPNDPNFAINGIALTGNPVSSVSFNIVTQAGGSYTVQGSTDLLEWITLDTDVEATDDSTPFSVNLADFPQLNGQPKVFFRAVFNE
jgi:hypothetical protein